MLRKMKRGFVQICNFIKLDNFENLAIFEADRRNSWTLKKSPAA